jgi:hypothetical protein
MKSLENVLSYFAGRPALHAKWLNTLSMMENTGARKIKNCEHPVFVNEIILKHAAEEARHAYYLKKQIAKVLKDACPTYEREYVLAPSSSCFYLHTLDIRIARYLRDTFQLTSDKLKYAAYLLVTYAIEVRADALYPVYQNVLSALGSPVSVKTIIAEEKNHLREMIEQLQEFSPDWEQMCNYAVLAETELFDNWIAQLSEIAIVTGSSN